MHIYHICIQSLMYKYKRLSVCVYVCKYIYMIYVCVSFCESFIIMPFKRTGRT